MESQNKQILKRLRLAPITAMDALKLCGSWRLSARIHDLRADGHKIKTTIITRNKKRIALYSLERG